MNSGNEGKAALLQDAAENDLLLGAYHARRGETEAAIAAYVRAIEHHPDDAEIFSSLGRLLFGREEFRLALGCFRRALELRPVFAEALNNSGLCLLRLGDPEAALVDFERALSFEPSPATWTNAGNARRAAGDPAGALEAFAQALLIDPQGVVPRVNRGLALVDLARDDEADAVFTDVLRDNPDCYEALLNRGTVLRHRGEYDRACADYRSAAALRPESADPWFNLGEAGAARGELEAAALAYREALTRRPGLHQAWHNLGLVLFRQRRVPDAIAAYERALSLRPEDPETHWNLALALLLSGDFARGWREFERRWESKDFALRKRNFDVPLWDGSDCRGRTILLHAEQGFGDAIQFVRFAAELAERGGRVIVECRHELARLFRGALGVSEVVIRGGPIPPVDFHCPLMSVPMRLGTTLPTLSADVPYLLVDPASVEAWNNRLEVFGPGFRVGLTWKGQTTERNDSRRSIPESLLHPLLGIPGVLLFSLQKDVSPAATGDGRNRIIDFHDGLEDFAETAALITQMDLVISIDTATAHLAGAMGKPVWTLLHHEADWRWLLDREDSPWYPGMTLFRQVGVGAWESVVERVADALRALAGLVAGGRSPVDQPDPSDPPRELFRSGDLPGVLEWYRREIDQGRQTPTLLMSLAALLRQLGRANDALTALEGAVALDPENPEAAGALGLSLADKGDLVAARRILQRAMRRTPAPSPLLNNVGVALSGSGRHGAAIGAYRAALRRDPGFVDAHWNLALALLSHGLYREGWQEYEWRWSKSDFPTPRRSWDVPAWEGQDLRGATLYLHAEQGFGDTIQFLRFLPAVAARGARVVLEVPPELSRLASASAGVAEVVVTGSHVPAMDFHLPLMSLARVLGATLDTLAPALPYVQVEPIAVGRWKKRLPGGRRVGIVWQGRPTHREDRKRSISLSMLRTLFDTPGVAWVSLQMGESVRELKWIDAPWRPLDPSPDLHDFADTAALIASLDLVIAVDTAVAHLSGALGTPTWILLHHVADWRWLVERDDSPWYPTARLFRQEQPGAWEPVIAQARAELCQWLRHPINSPANPQWLNQLP